MIHTVVEYSSDILVMINKWNQCWSNENLSPHGQSWAHHRSCPSVVLLVGGMIWLRLNCHADIIVSYVHLTCFRENKEKLFQIFHEVALYQSI